MATLSPTEALRRAIEDAGLDEDGKILIHEVLGYLEHNVEGGGYRLVPVEPDWRVLEDTARNMAGDDRWDRKPVEHGWRLSEARSFIRAFLDAVAERSKT